MGTQPRPTGFWRWKLTPCKKGSFSEKLPEVAFTKKKKIKKKFTDEIAVTVWDSAETRWFKRVTEILYFEKWHRSRQASSRAMPRQTTNIVRMPCIPHVLCTLYLYIHFTFYTYVQLLSFGSEACFVVVVCVCLRNLCVQSHVKCEWLSAIRP